MKDEPLFHVNITTYYVCRSLKIQLGDLQWRYYDIKPSMVLMDESTTRIVRFNEKDTVYDVKQYNLLSQELQYGLNLGLLSSHYTWAYLFFTLPFIPY